MLKYFSKSLKNYFQINFVHEFHLCLTYCSIEVVDGVVVKEEGRRGHGEGDDDGPEDVLRRRRMFLSNVLPPVKTCLRTECAEILHSRF